MGRRGARLAGLAGLSGLAPATEISKIKAYLNFDMTGSPNPTYQVYNASDPAFPPGSATLQQRVQAGFTSLNIQSALVNVQGRSDHGSFAAKGIPVGGTAGQAFDPCYHKSCDTTSNVNATALDRNADLIAYALWATAA